MGTPWRAQGVRTSIVHRYGTVERPVEPRRVPLCQNRVPTETRRNPIWPDGTQRAPTDHSTVPYQCVLDSKLPWQPNVSIRDVTMSGRHGDTAQTGTARSGTVPTRPDTVRHGLAWRGLAWLIEVRGLANRGEGSGL